MNKTSCSFRHNIGESTNITARKRRNNGSETFHLLERKIELDREFRKEETNRRKEEEERRKQEEKERDLRFELLQQQQMQYQQQMQQQQLQQQLIQQQQVMQQQSQQTQVMLMAMLKAFEKKTEASACQIVVCSWCLTLFELTKFVQFQV